MYVPPPKKEFARWVLIQDYNEEIRRVRKSILARRAWLPNAIALARQLTDVMKALDESRWEYWHNCEATIRWLARCRIAHKKHRKGATHGGGIDDDQTED